MLVYKNFLSLKDMKVFFGFIFIFKVVCFVKENMEVGLG